MVSAGRRFQKHLLRIRISYSLKQAIRLFAGLLCALGLAVLLFFHLLHTVGSDPLMNRALLASAAFLALAAAAGAAYAGKTLFASDRKLTRWIEKMRPDLGSALTGANELLNQDLRGASPFFAEAHCERSVGALGGLAGPGSAFSAKSEASLAFLLLPFALLFVLLFRLYPSLADGWRSAFTLPGADRAAPAFALPAAKARAPVLGDVVIRYRFPAYTGLPERTESNRSGRIRCLKGTHVTLAGRCVDPVFSPALVTRQGVQIPVRAQGETLAFSFDVLREDAYRLSAADSAGRSYVLLEDTIICDPDLFPEVVLHAETDQKIVRRKEALDLGYRASDDFGLKSLRLVFAREADNREEKQAVSPGNNARSAAGTFQCDLSYFNLKEGERGALLFEATDNDAVSGSKTARSAPLFITVLDEGRAHAEVEAKIKALMDRMVFLLADHLEDGVSGEREPDRVRMKSALFDSKSFDLLQAAREVLLVMESDQRTTDEIYSALSAFTASFGEAVEGRRRAVSVMAGGEAFSAIGQAESREMEELEDILFFMTEAKEREKVDNLLSGMEDALFDEKEFEEALSGKSEDEKIRALREKLEALQKELSRLFSDLMKDRKESPLPEEFLNADALKNLPRDKISEAMEKIRKALDRNDADQALAEMLKLRDLLDQLHAALNSAAGEYYNETFQREMELMQKAASELEGLINQQTRLNASGEEALREMEEKIRELMEKAQERKKEAILRLFDEQLDRLGGLAGASPEKNADRFRSLAAEMRARTASAKERFRSGDAGRSAGELKQNRPLQENARKISGADRDTSGLGEKLSGAESANEKLIALLEQPYAPFDDMLSPSERSRLGQMANQQGSIAEQLKAMENGLKAALENMGSGGKSVSENFQGCKSGLGSSFNRMSEYNLPSAMPSAKSGLYYMMRLKESLKQGMASMRQGSGMCPFPSGSDISRSRRSGGRTGLAEGDVEMENRRESESELKEMIKKAIKEKGPEEFEAENKKYYEKLGN